jgi:murein DD-endopeptidase MepM/ murein hydrolase activator NlpD
LVSRTSGSLCGCEDGADQTSQERNTRLIRRGLLLGGLWGAANLGASCSEDAIANQTAKLNPSGTAPLRGLDLPVQFVGTPRQSGVMIGITEPEASVDAAGIATTAGPDGKFVFGLDRDAPATATISVRTRDGRTTSRTLNVAPRAYPVRSISGLPAATVNPPPEAMARIEADAAIKQRAFLSRDERERGFEEAFRWPLSEVRVTSPWGAQRNLNGALQRPHYGIDLGAATGTPILAPASGLIILAEPSMHFEGGIVAIDHGQGLISIYLHQSRIAARVGQRVRAGDLIGEVGARGRATGPHLCWRMRWRGRQVDPSLMVA